MIDRRQSLVALAAWSSGLGAATAVRAQGPWPNGPLRFVVPYPPGGRPT